MQSTGIEERLREITCRTDLPDEAIRALKERGIPEQDIEVAAASDLSEQGCYGEMWVVATSSRLLTLAFHDQGACILLDRFLEGFKEFRSVPQVGNAILEAQARDGEIVDLLRYTQALSRRFSQVAKHLERLAQGQADSFSPDKKVLERMCPTCGRGLGQGSPVCPHCFRRGKTVKRLMGHALRYKALLFSVWGLLILCTAADMAPPYITKILVDSILPAESGQLAGLALMVLALTGIRLSGTLMRIVQLRLTSLMALSVTYDIRRGLFAHLQFLSLSFYDTRKIGNIMSRVTNDTGKVLQFLSDGIQNLLVNLLTVIGIAVMLFLINWRLASYVLLPIPIVIFTMKITWERLRTAHFKVHVQWAHVSGVLNDALSGIRVVKAFGQESQEKQRFGQKNNALFAASVDESRLSQTLFPLMAFLTTSGTFLIWWVGGLQVMRHEVSLGTLVAFLGYLGMLYAPLRTLTNMGTWLTRTLTAAERVFEVMDCQPEITEADKPMRVTDLQGRVEFRNVTFGYDPNLPVLKDISFSVAPGEMIGLVGRSGAGKTTLINLLCRFYDVTEGQILVDGQDLRELCIDDYRRSLGVVLQEPFLFGGSILENIAYPRPEATLQEVMQAARMANAHEFILRSQDGYDTQVGDRGHRLSGGERQRISISRAILHNPKILILDEATASVDTETEKRIQEALTRLVEGRTVFAIAHRLSTLRNADRLIVIEEGRSVEMGTHDELLDRRGSYYKLVRMQQKINEMAGVAV